jgi:hypothetical protein
VEEYGSDGEISDEQGDQESETDKILEYEYGEVPEEPNDPVEEASSEDDEMGYSESEPDQSEEEDSNSESEEAADND